MTDRSRQLIERVEKLEQHVREIEQRLSQHRHTYMKPTPFGVEPGLTSEPTNRGGGGDD